MSKRICAALVAAAGFFVLPAHAQAPAQPSAKTPARTDCLRLGQVDSFSAIRGNERAFVVTDKLRRRFRINLMYRCPGLDFNMAVGFKTLESGSLACIARGDTVISRDVTRAGDRCPISSVEPYTPAMEAADKAAAAAKRQR
jgi:hypothetical protein